MNERRITKLEAQNALLRRALEELLTALERQRLACTPAFAERVEFAERALRSCCNRKGRHQEASGCDVGVSIARRLGGNGR
jgi:hypothetical protein